MSPSSKIEYQTSRNGLIVPVVDGVYLHSIYNPTKEASAFIENYEDVLKKKNNILVLGLGFGYHVEQLSLNLSQLHSSYNIVVVERNQELVSELKKQRPFLDNKIKIVCEPCIEDFYFNSTLIQILLKKPGIIKLDSAFNLDKNFYRSFLTYKAKSNFSSYKNKLDENSKEMLSGLKDEDCFSDHIAQIKRRKNALNKEDYLLLALSEIATVDKKGLSL